MEAATINGHMISGSNAQEFLTSWQNANSSHEDWEPELVAMVWNWMEAMNHSAATASWTDKNSFQITTP